MQSEPKIKWNISAIIDEVHIKYTNEYAFNKIVGPFDVNVIINFRFIVY